MAHHTEELAVQRERHKQLTWKTNIVRGFIMVEQGLDFIQYFNHGHHPMPRLDSSTML